MAYLKKIHQKSFRRKKTFKLFQMFYLTDNIISRKNKFQNFKFQNCKKFTGLICMSLVK